MTADSSKTVFSLFQRQGDYFPYSSIIPQPIVFGAIIDDVHFDLGGDKNGAGEGPGGRGAGNISNSPRKFRFVGFTPAPGAPGAKPIELYGSNPVP